MAERRLPAPSHSEAAAMFRHFTTSNSALHSRMPASRTPVTAACAAAFAWAVFAPCAVAATGPWHAGLRQAREASAASHRPVLAVFVAKWCESSTRIADTLLVNAEAAALVKACFEPVLIDVDEQAELTRRFGISHVPTAAVLASGDEVATRFECPDSPAEFIAAAARASREAAERNPSAAVAGAATSPRQSLAVQATASDVGGNAFSTTDADRLAAPAGQPAAAPPSSRGSISMVTAKVRQLSDFASQSPAPSTPPSTLAVDFQQSSPVDQPAVAAQQQTPEPTLPQSPPAWPAEQASTPLAMAPTTPPTRPSIEPANPARDSPPAASREATAWLGTAPSRPAAPAETTASISDLPNTPAAQPAQAAEAPKKKSSAGADFIAALQKPFSGFARKPGPTEKTTPALPEAAKPAAPPAAAAVAATQDQEPMPLGLEGYCPVTLAEKSVWTEGRAQFGARHRGRTYLFAGPEQQQAFLADPDRYAPALSGDDPVLAFEQGKSMPGQRRYGLVCQSRMYLFASQETRDAFAAQPDRYTSRITLAERPAAPGAGSRTY
jgi:YHS domain-containing protein